MIGLSTFFIKHLYELMADSDQTDLDSLMVLMCQNQLPDLLCDTIVELLFTVVAVFIIWIILSLSNIAGDGQLQCQIISVAGCDKTIEAFY